MKELKILYLLICSILLSTFSYSQTPATSINKNVNINAEGLEHYLNKATDTLSINGDINIYRVSFLSHSEKETTMVDIGAKDIKIPLHHFSKGRYTVVVYRAERKVIVFDIDRLKEIGKPQDAIADLEESILRSSLSEKEQISRNFKPLKKDTRVAKANTNTNSSKPKTKSKKKSKSKPKIEISKTEDAVAVATVKKKKSTGKIITKKPKRKKNKTKPKAKTNQKSLFAIAAEKEAKNKKEENAVVANTNKLSKNNDIVSKQEEELLAKSQANTQNSTEDDEATVASSNATEANTKVKTESYNITTLSNDSTVDKQTREEYRQEHLRPNGTKYDDD